MMQWKTMSKTVSGYILSGDADGVTHERVSQRRFGADCSSRPFHWGDLFHAETNANYVTNPAFDPVSKQPELKFCAVRIEVDDS